MHSDQQILCPPQVEPPTLVFMLGFELLSRLNYLRGDAFHTLPQPPKSSANPAGMLFFVLGRIRAGAGPEPGRRAGVTAGRKRELRPGRSRGPGPEPGERNGVSARAGPEPGRSRARVRAGRKRGPGPGRSRARGREPECQSWAGAGPGQSQSRAEARPGRSERQPGRSRASVRWRTAGATCSAAWPPTLRSSEPAGAGVGAGAGQPGQSGSEWDGSEPVGAAAWTVRSESRRRGASQPEPRSWRNFNCCPYCVCSKP